MRWLFVKSIFAILSYSWWIKSPSVHFEFFNCNTLLLEHVHSGPCTCFVQIFGAFSMVVLRLGESNVKTECPFPLFDIYFRDIIYIFLCVVYYKILTWVHNVQRHVVHSLFVWVKAQFEFVLRFLILFSFFPLIHSLLKCTLLIFAFCFIISIDKAKPEVK